MEPPALLQMGLPDPALPAGVPTHAGVNRYEASGDANPRTTSHELHVLCVYLPPSLHIESSYGPGTNEISSLTASGQYH